MNNIDVQLTFITNSQELREVNDLLTRSMAEKKIQLLIKDENLIQIVNSIIDLALSTNDYKNSLLASAMLGRLGAVARSREAQVYIRLEELFVNEPPTIETLADGDEKQYAAKALSYLNKSWLISYSLKQAILIDTAENARRIFLQIALKDYNNISDFLLSGVSTIKELKGNENFATNFKRTRRLANACSETISKWNGEVGSKPGKALASWLNTLLTGDKQFVEDQILIDVVDDALSILLRLIELRFSFALQASTYDALDKAANRLQRKGWSEFIQCSTKLDKIRFSLKEAALVLARQGRTDDAVMNILNTAYYSRSQVVSALKAYFTSAQELDPDIRDWWIQGGVITKSQRKLEHQIGNSEDQQIGALLIEVENSKYAMDKLERAVVPFLEISDPPLAATVKKAAGGYEEMARITRQLARMRKLTKTDIQGNIIEYNPLQHEMLGGHKLGVRIVKVVREGIQKEFGGKTKTLVKPWVEEAE